MADEFTKFTDLLSKNFDPQLLTQQLATKLDFLRSSELYLQQELQKSQQQIAACIAEQQAFTKAMAAAEQRLQHANFAQENSILQRFIKIDTALRSISTIEFEDKLEQKIYCHKLQQLAADIGSTIKKAQHCFYTQIKPLLRDKSLSTQLSSLKNFVSEKTTDSKTPCSKLQSPN